MYVTALSGSIPAGGYYLVSEHAQGGGTTPLPTPDATGNISMSATDGKIALVCGTMNLQGCPVCGMMRDLVGYGGANCFEGAGPAPRLDNTHSDGRVGSGCTDSNNNIVD